MENHARLICFILMKLNDLYKINYILRLPSALLFSKCWFYIQVANNKMYKRNLMILLSLAFLFGAISANGKL